MKLGNVRLGVDDWGDWCSRKVDYNCGVGKVAVLVKGYWIIDNGNEPN